MGSPGILGNPPVSNNVLLKNLVGYCQFLAVIISFYPFLFAQKYLENSY